MGSTVAFHQAMEAIHHLADPVPPWHAILESARKLVGSDAGAFMVFGKGQELLMLEQTGIEEAAEQAYREHFYAEDTLAKAGLDAPAGTWWDDKQILPSCVVQKSAYHTDFLRKHRIGQVLAFYAQSDEFAKVTLSFQRVSPQASPVSALAGGAVARYTRGFVQALAQRSQAALARLESIEAAFASFGEATFLATRTGVVWRLSPLASDVLRSAKMLLADGRITHADPQMASRLYAVLSCVARTGVAAELVVPVAWGEVCHFDISLAHASVKLGTERILLVRVRKNSAFVLPDVDALCAAFGITPAEGRVLAGLMSGHTAGEYAAVSGVAEPTVRHQIASLMLKMGCHRQAELVRLGDLLR